MLPFFLNPWLLAGLAGISLPVIAHLLARRRHKVVDWGAMQFLAPGRRTRRRMRLEDLLLLLIRVAVIAILTLAFARPLVSGGIFASYRSGGSRDVVMIIDSSNSMSRPDGISTVHQTAIRRATAFLDTLTPGDTAMLIDARDVAVPVIGTPAADPEFVMDQLRQLAPPAGSVDLRAACELGVRLLNKASHAHRELIVFTDRQKSGWRVDDEAAWARFDDGLAFPAIRPRAWIVDCGSRLDALQNDVATGPVTFSSSLAVPGYPVHFQVVVRNNRESPSTVPLRVYWNRQRLPEHDTTVTVAGRSKRVVEFRHRFDSPGKHQITVRADSPGDPIDSDNAAHAIIHTRPAIKLLIAESSASRNTTRRHAFFLQAALQPPRGTTAWMEPRVVPAEEISESDIAGADVIILPDAARWPENGGTWLASAVRGGTGLLIAVGEDTESADFARIFVDTGLLPGIELTRTVSADPDAARPIRVLPGSLQAKWLQRFRERPDSSFLNAAFRSWWDVQIPTTPGGEATMSVPSIIARLDNNAPLLLYQIVDNGRVLLMTTTLDTRWNTLPTRPDFVPFVYESLFQLAGSRVRRNTFPGEPLVTMVKSDNGEELQPEFVLPNGRREPASIGNPAADGSVEVRCDKSFVPGLYELRDVRSGDTLDQFVVDYDHREDDEAELSDAEFRKLAGNDRLQFVRSLDVMRRAMYGAESQTELWPLLIWLFPALLLLESWMTHRLVNQRHGAFERQPPQKQ